MANEVIIIGGGLGGLSAAIHLAAKKVQVRLFEQEPQLGGKLSFYREKGYYWDVGPSVVTLPDFIRLPFAAAGKEMEKYLQLVPVDPLTDYYFPDGKRLRVWRSSERTEEELKGWGAQAPHRWRRFLQYARRLYETAAPLFLEVPLHEYKYLFRQRELWRWRNLLLPVDPFRSMHAAAQAFLKHPDLVRIADRYATYNGSDPFRAPATFNLIFWVENGLGTYHIKGGLYKLVQALGDLACELGVQMHLGEPVLQVLHRSGKVEGVETAQGFYPASAVISAVDVRTTYEKLLQVPFPLLYTYNEPSLSGLVFLWGVKRRSPFGHHTIIFSGDYLREFKRIFREKGVPEEPTIYICNTSATEPGHAPAGKENWFVLLNVPAVGSAWKESDTARLREATVKRIKKVFPEFDETLIEVEAIRTPADWERLGSAFGSLYGAASNRLFSAFLRPPNRSRRFRGLYFAGGSVHPGGGMPLVILSGRHAARLVLDYLASRSKAFFV
ncbi:MAG: NAD(P)/FAD-dependent oxidoreductase [Bacteroidia bacterium]|nr:NAD(P)/FAD-dependent oxidoreductase [Bacteroidia bacterium]MCX7763639.1 NAD(P)/FAD-dependent oxidoreductase [Bacteroidia bacterium]MDW8056733.1 phytoene desaturase family protein [Bacteroidia bacterium]